MKIFKLFSLAVFVLWGLTRPVFAIDDENTCSFMNPMEYTITSDGYVLYLVSTDVNNLCDCLVPGYYRDKVCFYNGDRLDNAPCLNDSSYRIGVKCVECPNPEDKGQPIARVNNNPLFIGAVNIDPEQSIEGCAVELNPEATVCNTEDEGDGLRTRVKIGYDKSYDHANGKYLRVLTNDGAFKITPKTGYYVDFPGTTTAGAIPSNYIDSIFQNDFCEKCPDPALTNPGYKSDLWNFTTVALYGNSNPISSGDVKSCALNLSSINSACGQSIVSYVYDSGVEKYKRRGNVPSTAPVNTSFVDPLPDEYDMGNDFCKGYCSGGQCFDEQNQCVSCPAGYYCPISNKNLKCQKPTRTVPGEVYAVMCEPASFSTGGATQCTQCANGYSTVNSGPELFTYTDGSKPYDGFCLTRVVPNESSDANSEETTFVTATNSEGFFGAGCVSSDACQLILNSTLCLKGNCGCTNKDMFVHDNSNMVRLYTTLDPSTNDYTKIDCRGSNKGDMFVPVYDDSNNNIKYYYKLEHRSDFVHFSKIYWCSLHGWREYNVPLSKMSLDCGANKSLGDSVSIKSTNQSAVRTITGATHRYFAD